MTIYNNNNSSVSSSSNYNTFPSSPHSPEEEKTTELAISILDTANQVVASVKKKRKKKKKTAQEPQNQSLLRFYPEEIENYILSIVKTAPTLKTNSIFDILFVHGQEIASKLDKALACVQTSFESDFCGLYFFFQCWSFHYLKIHSMSEEEMIAEFKKSESNHFIYIEKQIENYSQFIPSPLKIDKILCCDFLSIDPQAAINKTISISKECSRPKNTNEKINTAFIKRQTTTIKDEKTQQLITQFSLLLDKIRILLFSPRFLFLDQLPANKVLPPDTFKELHPMNPIEGSIKTLQLICSGHRSLTKHGFNLFSNNNLEALPLTEEGILKDPTKFYQNFLTSFSASNKQREISERHVVRAETGSLTKKDYESMNGIKLTHTEEKDFLDRLKATVLHTTIFETHASISIADLTFKLQITVPINYIDAFLEIFKNKKISIDNMFSFKAHNINTDFGSIPLDSFLPVNAVFDAFDDYCKNPMLYELKAYTTNFLTRYLLKEEKNEFNFLFQTIRFLHKFHTAFQNPFSKLENKLIEFKKNLKKTLKDLKITRKEDQINELKSHYEASYTSKLPLFFFFGSLLECAKEATTSHLNEDSEAAIQSISTRLNNRLLYLVSLFLQEEDFSLPPLPEPVVLPETTPLAPPQIQSTLPTSSLQTAVLLAKVPPTSTKKTTPIPPVVKPQTVPSDEARISLKKAIKVRHLTKLLEELGFSLERMRGDHAIYMLGRQSVVIPGKPRDILAPGTQKSIENRINEIVNG